MEIGFAAFTVSTIFFSSFLRIQIPRTNFYLTISDTLDFAALLLYGGEAAIVLATFESLATSLNIKRKSANIKTRTLFLNGAIAAVTTFATVSLLKLLFGPVSAIEGT